MTRPVGSFFRDQNGQLLCVWVEGYGELCKSCHYGGSFLECLGRDRSITGACAPMDREDGASVVFIHESNWMQWMRRWYNKCKEISNEI